MPSREKMAHKPYGLCWLILSAIILALDQLSKYVVSHVLGLYQTVVILPFFNFTLAHNRGAAFSFLNQTGNIALWLFAGIATVVSIAIIIWLYRLPRGQAWQGCALALILGGALGNLVDRLLHGFVIDFIQLHAGNWYWPAFNIADSAICVGAVILALNILFTNKSSKSSK